MRTIWTPSVQRRIRREDRFVVLYLAPLIYSVNALSYLVFGAVNGGSKVMRAAFGEWGSFGLNAAVGLAALCAMIGLVTIRHQLERWSSLVMLAGVISYLVLLFFALGRGTSPVSTLSGAVLTSVITFVRLKMIAKDIGRAEAKATS